jgi:hypothetical protein
MSYQVEYIKTIEGNTVTATPVLGRPDLPTLSVEVAPEDVDKVMLIHNVRTLDITKPGVTRVFFGVPGNVKVIHHDGEVITVDSHEAAEAHSRDGEIYILRSAYEHQK